MSVNFAAAVWWARLPFRHRFCVSSNKKVSLKHLTNLINFHFNTEINLFQMTFWKGFFFSFFLFPSSFNCWLKIIAALNIYTADIKILIWNRSSLILYFFSETVVCMCDSVCTLYQFQCQCNLWASLEMLPLQRTLSSPFQKE